MLFLVSQTFSGILTNNNSSLFFLSFLFFLFCSFFLFFFYFFLFLYFFFISFFISFCIIYICRVLHICSGVMMLLALAWVCLGIAQVDAGWFKINGKIPIGDMYVCFAFSIHNSISSFYHLY